MGQVVQALLGVHALADILAGGDEMGNLAADGIAQRRDALLLVVQVAVLAPVDEDLPEHLAGLQGLPEALVEIVAVLARLHQTRRLPQGLLAGIAGVTLEGRVDILDTALAVGDEDRVRGLFQGTGLLGQLRLRRLAGADIAHHTDEELFVLQPHFAGGQIHGEAAAVLAQTLHLAKSQSQAGSLAATLEIPQIAVMPITMILRHQHLHVPAQHLGLGVTEDLLGGGIEGFDTTLAIDGDDAIRHVFQHRPDARLGAPAFPAQPFLLGHVLQHQQKGSPAEPAEGRVQRFVQTRRQGRDGGLEPAFRLAPGGAKSRRREGPAAGQHLAGAADQVPVVEQFGEPATDQGIVAHVEQAIHEAIGGQHLEVVGQDQQPGRHAADDILRVLLEGQDGAPIGMEIGLQRQAHVEEHNLEQGAHRRPARLGIARALLPHLGQQFGEVFAVGPQVPLGVQPYPLVDQAHPQAVVHVVSAIVTGAEAVEIVALLVAQARLQFRGGDQGAGAVEAQQVGIEGIDEAGAGLLQVCVSFPQQADVVRAELQKGLAPGDLGGVESQLGHGRGNQLFQGDHGPCTPYR